MTQVYNLQVASSELWPKLQGLVQSGAIGREFRAVDVATALHGQDRPSNGTVSRIAREMLFLLNHGLLRLVRYQRAYHNGQRHRLVVAVYSIQEGATKWN